MLRRWPWLREIAETTVNMGGHREGTNVSTFKLGFDRKIYVAVLKLERADPESRNG
jgi:hypothetical protein